MLFRSQGTFGQGFGVDLRDLVSTFQRDVYRISVRRSDPEGSTVTITWPAGLTNVGGGGWYLVDGANGVIFPGLPGIILGLNDRGAWGATVSVFDVTDVYKETVTTPSDYPASPRTVLFRGRQVPVLRLEEQFRVNRGETVTRVVEVVPHHEIGRAHV